MSAPQVDRTTHTGTGQSGEITAASANAYFALNSNTATAIDVQLQAHLGGSNDIWHDVGTSLTANGISAAIPVPRGARLRLDITGTAVTAAETTLIC